MIKIISFDFDGTIVTKKFADDFWLKGVPKLYAKQNHINLKTAQNYLFKEYDKIGDQRIEWYDPAYWFNRFKINNDWNALLKHYQNSTEIYPEVIPVLQHLSQYYTLIISSNAKREFIEIQINASDLKQYFTHIFSSTSDFHTVKKVTDFYAMICKKLSIQPQEIIHIGDHKEFDYLAPQKLGITTFYLDRSKKNRGPDVVNKLTQFEEILIKNVLPQSNISSKKQLKKDLK